MFTTAFVLSVAAFCPAETPLPSPGEMAASRLDVWSEAAIRVPGGPSYEFYRGLLPPLRYVNTAFKHYPIVLSAPQSAVKARCASNGSGINLKADKPPMWKETGTPVAFFIGKDAVDFGADAENLFGPVYALSPRWIDKYPPKTGQYWLPIVEMMNRTEKRWCEQFAFAPTRGVLAEHGAVCVRFLPHLSDGEIRARIGSGTKYIADTLSVRDSNANVVVMFDSSWIWSEKKAELTAGIPKDKTADLIVFTKPLKQPLKELPSFEDERQALLETWCDVMLKRSKTRLVIPESVVQNAWQSLVVGNFILAVGDRMNYSAGNAYDHLYEAECGDALRSLLFLGHVVDAKAMLGPLLNFDRKATRYHVAGHKLQLLAHYYWVTRDKETIEKTRPKWEPVTKFIRDSRKTENGLLPKDNYAGDVSTQIFSLNSNANCWRGLRDMAAVLEETGDKALAAELRKEAEDFRTVILNAVTRSIRMESKPPFVPLSLLGDEPAHDPITATRMGSYYNLMIPYVLGSGILGDERDGFIIDYL
ncbi:hypothetical protein BH11PLA2_BH11PLA2_09870 [soil metagenome]